jgi:hypothetical protein
MPYYAQKIREKAKGADSAPIHGYVVTFLTLLVPVLYKRRPFYAQKIRFERKM